MHLDVALREAVSRRLEAWPVQRIAHGAHSHAAVAVARYHEGTAEVTPHFAGNNEVDRLLRSLTADAGRDAELWITDISWRDPETDAHLRSLAAAGVRISGSPLAETVLENQKSGTADETVLQHLAPA